MLVDKIKITIYLKEGSWNVQIFSIILNSDDQQFDAILIINLHQEGILILFISFLQILSRRGRGRGTEGEGARKGERAMKSCKLLTFFI